MRQKLLWTVVLGLALSSSTMAKNPQGNSQGKGKGNPHAQAVRDDHDRDDDHDRWERRENWEYHTYRGDERPPGWSKGKKTGWGNCNLPPGQAKKYGCNRYRHQGRDYYWYKNDDGRIVVRRPIITAHAGVEVR